MPPAPLPPPHASLYFSYFPTLRDDSIVSDSVALPPPPLLLHGLIFRHTLSIDSLLKLPISS